MAMLFYPHRSANPAKPIIRLDRSKPGSGKWECYSRYGVRIGKGYSIQEAYRKWSRAT